MRRSDARLLLLVAALFAALTARPGRAGEPASAGKGFTDVTAASGVAAVVAAHYRNVPKWWLSGMTLVDLDGDGDLDLHLAGHGCPAAAALNDGKGKFTYVDPKLSLKRGVRHDNDIPYPGGEIRLPHDFDEDGRVDLLCSWHDGGGVLYLNDCARQGGRSTANFRRSRDLDQFNRSCAMADVDGDGRLDYLADAGGRANPQIVILFGKGGGAFGRKRLIPNSCSEGAPVVVDVDADGDVDFVITRRGYQPPGRRICLNDGRGNFTSATKEAGLTEEGGSIHGVGDFDQDGDPDLICVEGRKAPLRLAIYLNDGKGRFALRRDAIAGLDKPHAPRPPRSTNWGGAVVTDVDNDGTADVLINGKYFLYVLRGTGGGRFAVANRRWGLPSSATSAVDEGLCFGDVNGDGMLDLVTCGPGPTPKTKGVSVFRNDLPKRHWLRVRPVGRKGNRAAAGATLRIHAAGTDGKKLLWCEQISLWGRQSFHNYYAPAQTERHFGLGSHEKVDVTVEFRPSGKRVQRRGVPADTTVELREPEP